jgi:hypothetical protein
VTDCTVFPVDENESSHFHNQAEQGQFAQLLLQDETNVARNAHEQSRWVAIALVIGKEQKRLSSFNVLTSANDDLHASQIKPQPTAHAAYGVQNLWRTPNERVKNAERSGEKQENGNAKDDEECTKHRESHAASRRSALLFQELPQLVQQFFFHKGFRQHSSGTGLHRQFEVGLIRVARNENDRDGQGMRLDGISTLIPSGRASTSARRVRLSRAMVSTTIGVHNGVVSSSRNMSWSIARIPVIYNEYFTFSHQLDGLGR